MLDYIKSRAGRGVIPITLLCTADLDGWVKAQPQAVAKWVKSTRFAAEPGETLLIAGTDGAVERALAGFGAQSPVTASVWDWAALPGALPEAAYRIDAELDADTTGRAALGWALATYRYDRYRATATARRFPTLVWPLIRLRSGGATGRRSKARRAPSFSPATSSTPRLPTWVPNISPPRRASWPGNMAGAAG